MQLENDIAAGIIGCAIKVHQSPGPGLLESAYGKCLYFELTQSNYFLEKQKPIPLIYETVKLDCGYRCDFLIEGKVLVEIKSIDLLGPIHFAQTLTYLRLAKVRLGLLINFNVLKLKDGIRRIAN